MTILKKHISLLALLLIFPSSFFGAEIISPPTISNGHWHPDKARNLDRLLIMKEAELLNIRDRILQGNDIFKSIYSNDYVNRDGNTIGGIYQNATRSAFNDRMDRAILAKNKAFVALMGIRIQGNTGNLIEMSQSEINTMREEALVLLRNFDNSAWSGGVRPKTAVEILTFPFEHQNDLYDLQYRSRELMCYLEAYDMLRPIGQARVWEENIARQLIKFASNIYFLADISGSLYAYNNHRIISGSALGMAAILFGDWGTNDSNFSSRDARSYMPKAWIGYGMININTVLYSYQVFSDGGYNEGPHYLRYGFAYALPFFKAMKIFGEVYQVSDTGQPFGDWVEEYSTTPGSVYSLRSPWFGRVNNAQPDIWNVMEWVTKIRMPDGRVPGIADTFNDTYFPETSIAGGYFFWPQSSFEPGIGDLDILNWALSTYADTRADFIAAGNTYEASPSSWDKLQVFQQTGDIVFRSGWGLNDIYLHVYAKNYVYSSSDYHRGPHLQDDNSSFLLSYNKQVLALDGGYISFNDKELVADPTHHNLILVTGQGPSRNTTYAQIENIQRGDFYNYARIRTDYNNASIRRSFLFLNDRYFIVKDRIERQDIARYQLALHGNDLHPLNQSDGVIWQKEDAVLQAFVTTTGGKNNLDYVFSDQIHDNGFGLARTERHRALSVGRFATNMQYLSILFPYESNIQSRPEIEDVPNPNFAAVFVDRTTDPDFGNRYEFIISQWSNSDSVEIPQNQYGTNNRTIESIKTDADLLVLSFDPQNPDDPNKINLFHKGMTKLTYGNYVLFPQLGPKMSPIQDHIMNEMDTLEIAIAATDPNGHYLSFSLSSEILPSFAKLIDNGNGTGTIQFTPGKFDAGNYNIQILVTDSGVPRLSDQVSFNLTVQNVNISPVAVASSDKISGLAPLIISFSGEMSSDIDGSIVSFLWNFGDGSNQTSQEVSHTFETTGKYTVILTVSDNERATDKDTLFIINHPDLTQIYISEVSYAVPTAGKFIELYNNLDYDVDLSEYKLIQTDGQGDLHNIYDFGSDEQQIESTTLIPARQFLIVGRGISKGEFEDYWEIQPDIINYNSGNNALFFGQIGYRWQIRYFDGIVNQLNGTIIDDTEQPVGGLNSRSFQSSNGIWTIGSHLDATPGFLDVDQSLPVELVSLEVIISENSILLQWKTESELNNLGFNILRSNSKDGVYEQIASFQTDEGLIGQGSSPSAKKYQFTDRNVEKNVVYWYKLVDIDYSGKETSHGPVKGEILFVGDNLFKVDVIEVPREFMLHDNFPNPFNSSTSIHFDVPESAMTNNTISISIHNVLGEIVTNIFRGPLSPGRYQLQWNGKNQEGRDMASGLYILSLHSPIYNSSKKMILLR